MLEVATNRVDCEEFKGDEIKNKRILVRKIFKKIYFDLADDINSEAVVLLLKYIVKHYPRMTFSKYFCFA